MTTTDLLQLARDLADDPLRWACQVRHDPAERTFSLVHEDDETTVWLVCWMPGHDTGFHDHDGCSGALTVVRGAVCEERLAVGSAGRSRVLQAGQGVLFGGSDIHRVTHVGTEPAVTIHAYAPRLRAMGAYEIAPNGVLRRHVVPEGQALEPVVG